MGTESNTGFRHPLSFQSGAVNSSPKMIPMGNYLGASTSSTGILFPGNVAMNVINCTSGLRQTGNSSACLLLDSVPGLKHEVGLSTEWSAEEQCKLEEGLEKFQDEPSVTKYVKIAVTIPDKTVRDVALRCRWMARKRRKGGEHTKKVSNRKDKPMESSAKLYRPSNLPRKSAIYSPFIHNLGENAGMSCEGLSSIAMHLQQNSQAFSQISSNLSMYKLHENINLFYRTRNNISAILNEMREMPGIMSQMPPLPVSVNEDLVNSFWSSATQRIMCGNGIPTGIHLKQEPRI